jgi:hypothetical protein
MSVSGISSSSLFGQDLQSGNLSAAQADFATQQQAIPTNFVGPTALSQPNSTSSSQSSNPIAQEFSQLSQDLQSGNVSAAQKDYSTIQQDFQSQAGKTHHHHHHHGGGGSGESAMSQLLSQLGQALQSGNLSAAQQAYSTLQQDFQQFTQTNASNSTPASSTVSNSVAVNA